MYRRIACVSLVAALVPSFAFANLLLVNPGFEVGDGQNVFNGSASNDTTTNVGWTATTAAWYGVDRFNDAPEGLSYAYLGVSNTGGAPGVIETVASARALVTAGEEYELTASVRSGTGFTPSAFTLNIDFFDNGGSLLGSITESVLAITVTTSFASFSVTGLAPANSVSAGARFTTVNGNDVDDFNLTLVPEPAALTLCGAMGLLLARRRQA